MRLAELRLNGNEAQFPPVARRANSALTCEPADFAWLFSFVVLIRDPTLPWERRPHCPTFGGIFGLDCANPWEACLACREYASGAVPFPARLSIAFFKEAPGRDRMK